MASTSSNLIFGVSKMFENRTDDELPKTWRKRARHSTQGCTLTEMVGLSRVMRLVKDLHAKSRSPASFAKTCDRLLLTMDNRFRAFFFAKRFGDDIDMVDAALMYVELLEHELAPYDAKETDLRKALEIGTVHEFRRWCLQWCELVPRTEFQAVALICNLSVSLSGVSLTAKAKAREWLNLVPQAKMSRL